MCVAIASLGMSAFQTLMASTAVAGVGSMEKSRKDAEKEAKTAQKMQDLSQMGRRQGTGARVRPQRDQRPKGRRTLRIGGGSTY